MSYYGRAEGGGGFRGNRGGHGGGRFDRRGGGRGGGRFGGRGGGRNHEEEPPVEFNVQTNVYQTRLVGKDISSNWHQYRVVIVPKKTVKEKDWTADGKPPAALTVDDAHPERISRFQNSIKTRGSNDMTRKILKELSLELLRKDQLFVTDGAAMAYSPERLFEDEEAEFGIKVDRQNFQVVLKYTSAIPLGPWFHQPNGDEAKETIHKILQCLQTIFVHAMSFNWIAVEKDPSTFFLNETSIRRLLQDNQSKGVFRRFYNNPTAYAPYIGLSQAAKFNDQNQFTVAIVNKIDWLYREEHQGFHGDGKAAPVPLLDERNGTLAGIHLPNINRKITDERTKAEIEGALKKMTFKIIYTKGDGWVKNRIESGKNNSYVKRNRVMQKRGQRMFQKDKGEPRLKWSCDEERFEKKQGEEVVSYDIASYFEKIYDIQVKFPHLPIVSTNRGWYPVEFLYQERSRVNHSNKPEIVKEVLTYHDAYAGDKRLDHIQELKQLAYEGTNMEKVTIPNMTEYFRKFGIEVDSQAMEVPARRIQPPALQFEESKEENPWKGSWNLNRKRFKGCASLPSYAVVDLGRRGNSTQAKHFMKSLFSAMQGHGMSIGNHGAALLDHVTVEGSGRLDPEELYSLFAKAVQRARACFLESYQDFKELGFRTTVRLSDGVAQDSIVTRNPGDPNAKYFAIPCDTQAPTHRVTNPSNDGSAFARIQFLIRGDWVDPVDVITVDEIEMAGYKIGVEKSTDDIDGTNAAKRGSHEIEYIFVSEQDVIANPPPLYPFDINRTECPALIFFYIPEHSTEVYDCIKALSDIEFGVNTQCIVQAKCSAQRRIEQYCSNIALKVNTKLFSTTNVARGWDLQGGLPWVGDAPTMIFGYSISNGIMDNRVTTVIAGAVCLSQDMTYQSTMQTAQSIEIMSTEAKTDTIDRQVLKDLVKSCTRNYYNHFAKVFRDEGTIGLFGNRQTPMRVIVYRDGGSEGSFDKIHKEEVTAIRDSICEINGETSEFKCPNECSVLQCEACAPRITMIVAQKDHNMRFIPTDRKAIIKNNSPSGTLVSTGITSNEQSADRFDFFLTSQGGLKGTSKPMHYCVIVNENKAPPTGSEGRGSSLQAKQVEEMTYRMAFQYGTATKAPRKVPVLLNSERLANRVIKYGQYLRRSKNVALKADFDQNRLFRVDENDERQMGIFGGSNYEHGTLPFRPHITG